MLAMLCNSHSINYGMNFALINIGMIHAYVYPALGGGTMVARGGAGPLKKMFSSF